MVATAMNGRAATGVDTFFSSNAFYVEERRGSLKSRNEFAIWNGSGQRIGAMQQPVSVAGFFWRVFLSPAILPFRIELQDRQRQSLGAIRRGWTIFVSRTEVLDSRGTVIGYLKHKHRSRKPRLKIFNAEGKKIGEVTGTSAQWDMDIIDRDYQRFGSIREFDPNTTPADTAGKDTYFIELQEAPLTPDERQVMLTVAMAIDRLILLNG